MTQISRINIEHMDVTDELTHFIRNYPDVLGQDYDDTTVLVVMEGGHHAVGEFTNDLLKEFNPGLYWIYYEMSDGGLFTNTPAGT